ncbi:MAG: DUF2812 domain-containing protein [Lachnospiraceae bacterium]|nr:DUF2812 domain-containing protein [Lachnospiraceae bacterium]
MKKLKFYFSLLKERDWLEEMATQGWLLTNITFGILYHFKETEPCEKVYEIERFAVSAHPTVSELTAKTRAIDIASQFGWEVVTHDEDMNYYFAKDKAGDETDEFYDDEESRMDRAERYRKHYSIEQPASFLLSQLVMSLLYICLCFILERDIAYGLMWIYLLLTTFEIALIFSSMVIGQRTYREFSMSREEWALYKKHSEKKGFNKVQPLRSYLHEKSEQGLALKSYENKMFLFEEDSTRYNYFIDTKANLKKRMKQNGTQFTDETKNWSNTSLKWYEVSIADAAKYGLKPVAVINKSVLVYKRPYGDQSIPWENGNENINFAAPTLAGAIIMLVAFIIGVIIGALAALII